MVDYAFNFSMPWGGYIIIGIGNILSFWYIFLANTQGLGFDVSDIYDSYVIHIFS